MSNASLRRLFLESGHHAVPDTVFARVHYLTVEVSHAELLESIEESMSERRVQSAPNAVARQVHVVVRGIQRQINVRFFAPRASRQPSNELAGSRLSLV